MKLTQDIILTHPKPLFHSDSKLAVLWSAKSGCTFITRWFLYQVGFLNAALYYHGWLHNFRQDVLEKSKGYLNNIHKILEPEVHVIKLVRNPYSRVVSSYIHSVKAGYEDQRISRFLNRQINEKERYSFREFINYLDNIDLRKSNIHHRLQIHPTESENLIKLSFVIKLENCAEEIRQVEESLGLKKSNLEELRKKSYGIKSNYTSDSDISKVFDIPFKKGDAFPPAKAFFDEGLKESIYRLYQPDFEQYDYNMEDLS